ncbi:MAG: histidinol phosphate phosphatase domain-containing protein [Deltaproteobacteria bacterium]
MIDLHMHTLLSDGELLPSELIRRARVAGYTGLAITDHADDSNIELVIKQCKKACAEMKKATAFIALPGVELTHIPIGRIAALVKKARSLGAKIVVGHGQTSAEPVEDGTNRAFINAGVNILAHPGLISREDCLLAKVRNVCLEITSRPCHSISNGHVAKAAKEAGASLVLNSDSHAPQDILCREAALNVALGAGLDERDFKAMEDNAKRLLNELG